MHNNGLFVKNGFDFHLYSVNYSCAAVGKFRSNKRNCFELAYKIDGCSTQVYADESFELVPNTIYFMPKFSENSFIVKEPGTIINIFFDIIDSGPSDILSPELIKLPPNNRYKRLFMSALEVYNSRGAGYYLSAHSIVGEIFAGLAADREQQYMQSAKYLMIQPAVEHIKTNFTKPISVSKLADLCGISHEYLRKLFRSYTGQSPLCYINSLRLEYARELLLIGNASVSEVAQLAGFDNPGYFSRLFKKYYKIPPSRVSCAEAEVADIYKKAALN